MFDNNDTPQQPQMPTSQRPATPGPQGPGSNMPLGAQPPPQEGQSGQVYTMPQQFMPAEQKQKQMTGKKKTTLIWIGVVAAVLVIIAAIVVVAYQITSRPEQVLVNTTGEVLNESDSNTNAATSNKNENANNNTNANDNENTNASSGGTLLNLTVNEELNENINDGLFPDNANVDANAAVGNISATELLPDRSRVQDTRDKDRDGLTDIEENIFGTDPTLPDTDKDGFIDGSEVSNLFAPDASDKGLLSTGSVIEYKNKSLGWSIYYPSLWIAEPTSNANTEVLFTADSVDGEFVQVIVIENTKKQTAAEWFAGLYVDVEPKDLDEITVGVMKGITTPDGFTTYVADNSYIIGIVYNFGSKEKISFRTTYEMMVGSFTYTPPPKAAVNANENTNANANDNTANTNNTNADTSANANVNTNAATSANANANANTNSNTVN